MKKFLLLLLIAVCSICQADQRWYPIEKMDNGTVYADILTFKNPNGHVDVWLKVVAKQNTNGVIYDTTLDHYNFDCANRKYWSLYVTAYSKGVNVLTDSSVQRPQDVVPGTIMESVTTGLCNIHTN